MSLFEHLLDANARLVGALDVPDGDLPEVEALESLLSMRAALLQAIEEAAQPAPTALRPLLQEQHHRLDGLLQQHTRETNRSLARLERFEQAQARYQAQPTRQVLRNGLNI